jgi:hypothetical protein
MADPGYENGVAQGRLFKSVAGTSVWQDARFEPYTLYNIADEETRWQTS